MSQTNFELGLPDQLSYVVRDLEASLPHYEALFGPFKVVDSPLEGVIYRGRESSCRLRIALNNAGPLEIELIQVTEGDTPHKEHLERHGEGLHHVRFRVQEIDDQLKRLEAAGYETVFYKRFNDAIAFAYVETPSAMGGSVIELLQLP